MFERSVSMTAVLATGILLSASSASVAEESADDVTVAVQASLAAGAEYLLSGIQNTNGWTSAFLPPTVRHGVSRTWTVTNRYSHKISTWDTRTIYYEEYETLEQKPSESPGMAPLLVKVKKRRRINSPAEAKNPRYVKRVTERVRVGEGTETHTGKVLVYDEDGPIVKVRTHRSPGIATYWPAGFLGQNGMALLSLLKCGVPEDTEQVHALAESLNVAVLGYGAPDTTWDLAWLAAAFAHLENEDFQETRDLLLSKLLDGQIATGSARGLWGPVCINSVMLAKALEYNQSVMARAAKIGDDMDPDVEAELLRIGEICRRIAQQGLRFLDVMKWCELGLNERNYEGLDVITEGLPYSFYSETFADMESTSVALYALSQARKQGVLPEAPIRPDEGKKRRKQTWPRADKSDAILARCASTVAKLQSETGEWSEANIQQKADPIGTSFAGMLPAFALLKLDDPTSATSTARGCSSLFRLGWAAGMDKMLGRYRNNLLLASRQRVALAQQYVKGEAELELPAYCHFLPEEYVFNFTGIQRYMVAPEERDRGLWQSLAIQLLRRQSAKGNWPVRSPRHAIKSTSVWLQLEPRERAWMVELNEKWKDKVSRRDWSRTYPEGSDAFYAEWLKRAADKHRRAGRHRSRRNYRWLSGSHPVLLEESVAPTCFAMLFLCDGLRPPSLAYVVDSPRGTAPKLLPPVLSNIKKRDERDAQVLRLEPGREQVIQGRPVILAASLAFLEDPGLARSIREALSRGATLVVEGPAAASASPSLLPLVPGGKPGVVAEDAEWLANYAGTRPEIDAIIGPGGKAAAILLPWTGGSSARPGMTISGQIMQISYLLASHRVREMDGSALFDTSPESFPDAITLRDVALARLSQRKTAAQPVTDSAGPPSSAPELKPRAPKKDEVW